MRPVVSVVGPTATGKSDLAVDLARALGGEIINSDAMQFYRGMDIGTAKLPPAERGGVPHHLIDILDPHEDASVAEYQRAARGLITDLQAAGSTPVLVGGSGLYVRAATDVMEFPGTDPDVRARLEERAESDLPALQAELSRLDPVAAVKIADGDRRRIVRALEVIELTGRPFSASLPEYTAYLPHVQIGLDLPREILRERIARRVERMWQDGWVAEVERLLAVGIERSTTAPRAIGYAQIISHLRGETTAQQARADTITRTRQFAKRQVTWFRRDRRIHWLDPRDPDLLDRTLAVIASAEGTAAEGEAAEGAAAGRPVAQRPVADTMDP